MDDLDRELTIDSQRFDHVNMKTLSDLYRIEQSIHDALDELISEARRSKDQFERGMMPSDFSNKASELSQLVGRYRQIKEQANMLKFLKGG